ncbi:MAG: threonylcarbamoyl-AMP synthase [Phycisphaerales bacterium]|nr:threonylcarbamoyl-AMP synthase [Phycisphaerales bacterium]
MATIVPYTHEWIVKAASALGGGEVVAFATETVYGLGADSFNPTAIERVYALKERPWNNPLIAHVLDSLSAKSVTEGWSQRCDRLASRFWPGPLTLILQRGRRVPVEAAGGLATIAVRSPKHPLARSLLYASGSPISAPSANRSGRISPTTAQHVAADYPDQPDLIVLDGGPCTLGIESTVLDLTDRKPVVRRLGGVGMEAIERLIGAVEVETSIEQGVSPGSSARHYAPTTPSRLVPAAELAAALASASAPAAVVCFEDTPVSEPHLAIRLPRIAEEYARGLYGALRTADSAGRSLILVEEPVERVGLWAAVHDRLRRATA